MVNVNEYLNDLDEGKEVELCPDCEMKVNVVLDYADLIEDVLEIDYFSDEYNGGVLIEIINDLYNEIHSIAYRQGIRDLAKKNVAINCDLLDELDELEELEDREEY